MTVQVRSMKMTRSLFNQLVQPPMIGAAHADHYQSIGWVLIKEKFIIIYDSVNQVIFKTRPILFTGKSKDGCTVHFNAGRFAGSHKFRDFVEADRWITTMRRFMAEAREKGQIFI